MSRRKRRRRVRIELDDLEAYRARQAAGVTVSSATGGKLVDATGANRTEEQVVRDVLGAAVDGH